jgi:hypothetical protein
VKHDIDNHEAFIEALFAKNKAIYGDARMELTEDETTEETPEGETPEETPEESETPEEKPEAKPADDLPEWAQKELTSVRAEAANYRTRLRDAEATLANAKTPEEVAAAIAELTDKNAKLERSLLVRDVAAEYKLPSELAELLQGDDIDALKEHAKKLAKFAPADEEQIPEALGGGLTPNDDSDTEMDPRKLARRVRRI